MTIYSEILVADFESTLMNETQSTGKGSCNETGTWITSDSKQSILVVVNDKSANNLQESSFRYFMSTTSKPRTGTRKASFMSRSS